MEANVVAVTSLLKRSVSSFGRVPRERSPWGGPALCADHIRHLKKHLIMCKERVHVSLVGQVCLGLYYHTYHCSLLFPDRLDKFQG